MSHRRAFTLVEVVFATALAGVLLVAVQQLFVVGTRAARRVELLSDATDSVGGALVQLTRRLRYVQSIDVPVPGETRDRVECSDIDTGAFTLSVLNGELVVEEKFGLDRKVLARGLHAVRFHRDRDLPHLLYVVLEIQGEQGLQRYRSAIYARGSRRVAP